jgi:DNA-binding MarR family transcriptional regulator
LRTLWGLNHAIEVTSKRMEATLGVTAQQRIIVRLLGTYPGISASEIAELLHVHRATVSVALNRLEARGIAKRVRDLADSRRVRLTLTRKGKALDVRASGTVESAVDHVLEHVGSRELTVMRRTIVALVTALQSAK